MPPAIEVYAAFNCPYCWRVKRLLKKKGVQFREHRVWLVGPWFLPTKAYREMVARTGGETVPQVLVGGAPLGGCEEIMALERDGKLDSRLAGRAP